MLRLTAFFLLAFTASALADAPTAPKMPPPLEPEPHISSYGAHNAACLEWTNSCQICTRSVTDGKMGETHCSTPGIACTPAATICRIKK